jgi:hypothetical protein
VNPVSLLLLLLVSALFGLSYSSIRRMLTVDEPLDPPSSGWLLSERAYWRMERGWPVLYFASAITFIPVLIFAGFKLEDEPVAVSTLQVCLASGVCGYFLGFFVAVTGAPKMLVPRSLRPGGVQAELVHDDPQP